MKRKIIAWIAMLLVVILPLTGLAEIPVSKENPLSLNTTTLYGKSISSSIFKNYDLIMVNYWAEWCGPCVGELPDLQKISKNYKNVLVLGVYVDDSVSDAIETAEDAGVTYPLFEVTYDLYNYLDIGSDGMFGIPQTCFFNNKGYQLGSAYVGGRDYASWSAIVEEMLAVVSKNTVSKPVIQTQPSSAGVKAGKKVTFKVAAKGDKLKYQWYYRTSSSGAWKKVTSGGTSATYSFKAKAKQNGWQYRCLVKNSAGKVYSKTVKLKVKK